GPVARMTSPVGAKAAARTVPLASGRVTTVHVHAAGFDAGPSAARRRSLGRRFGGDGVGGGPPEGNGVGCCGPGVGTAAIGAVLGMNPDTAGGALGTGACPTAFTTRTLEPGPTCGLRCELRNAGSVAMNGDTAESGTPPGVTDGRAPSCACRSTGSRL